MQPRIRTEEAHARLQDELVQEGAAALRRIGARLEELLGELARRRDGAARAPEAEHLRRAREDFARVRAEAKRYPWYLEVQREAIGIRNHQGLEELYPMPPPLEP